MLNWFGQLFIILSYPIYINIQIQVRGPRVFLIKVICLKCRSATCFKCRSEDLELSLGLSQNGSNTSKLKTIAWNIKSFAIALLYLTSNISFITHCRLWNVLGPLWNDLCPFWNICKLLYIGLKHLFLECVKPSFYSKNFLLWPNSTFALRD